MQFKLLSISALAAVATAATTAVGGINVPASDLPALLSVLPSSVLAYAEASPTQFASKVSSEFAHSHTPSWFTKLPIAIQTQLHPVNGTAATANGTVVSTSSTVTSTGKTTKAHTAAGKTTKSSSAPKGNPTNGAASSASSSSSSGGASLPTAIVGAGLAGVVGVVGLFAL